MLTFSRTGSAERCRFCRLERETLLHLVQCPVFRIAFFQACRKQGLKVALPSARLILTFNCIKQKRDSVLIFSSASLELLIGSRMRILPLSAGFPRSFLRCFRSLVNSAPAVRNWLKTFGLNLRFLLCRCRAEAVYCSEVYYGQHRSAAASSSAWSLLII